MNLAHRITVVLVLASTAWPSVATEYFWNCTKPNGIKYADATRCDRGDTALKVMKGEQKTLTQAKSADAKLYNSYTDPDVCPKSLAYCVQPDYGVAETSPRAQAIAQFMRKKQCEFSTKFPGRCAKPP